MNIINFNFDDTQVINSFNFARFADVVYSEVVSFNQYESSIRTKNTEVIRTEGDLIFYRTKNIDLFEGCVIFANTINIKNLFYYLNKVKDLKNLQLITHQTDIEIDKGLFDLKPTCISKWYSPNITYNHPDLIPIPLGIANDYSRKNLTSKYFLPNKIINQKINKIYINFVKNTNEKKRSELMEYFKNKNYVTFDNPNLDLNRYKEKLQSHKFVLCPPGNGLDTHRMWETLYVNSVPVVEKNISSTQYSGLPIIFYENIEEINIDSLNEKYKSLNYSNEMLNIKWWENKIKISDISKKDIQIIKCNKLIDLYFDTKNYIRWKILNKFLKLVKYFISKIFNIKFQK